MLAGMDGYVSKPIRTADLFAAIESVVGKTNSASVEGSLEVPLKS
jgi:CheY-like chemotaxis protein